ncbi:Zinc finger, RING/FYVE/PHD-type [Cynara cardunculus var. scolymus]|uniref:E3 ubiquitin protein ligase n=1 Tax=Cynara cardunculus var. scolymus TaxID=59895 RepID=A0A118JXY1_CYNCS|nr:Zinc finger, RING/FYVE/PHD-type [Cynara cardunculus var. scolymus]
MMGGTGEADRKRHFSSISSPTAAAAAKKHPFVPPSEDKKLDTVVLKFQNQKLVQKLESQKVECVALENKFSQLREKQLPYNKTLAVVDKSWEELVDKVESCSIRTKYLLNHDRDGKHHPAAGDNASLPPEDVFLHRLLEKGATESSSANSIPSQVQECREISGNKVQNTFRNIVHAIDCLWGLKDGLYAESIKQLPEGSCRPNSSIELEREVKNLRLAIGDMHLKHRSLARQMQFHRDTDAKNKSELRQLRGELECTIAELEESNKNLAALKAETDAAKGAIFPVLLGNKRVANDRAREKEKDLHDMESLLKELLDQASSRQLELKRLHEERMEILKQLSSLQNTLKNVKGIFSSEAFVLVKDQIAKARGDIVQYQALFEKLQVVEKDNLGWREKEVNVKNDIGDVLRRTSAVADSRISDLQMEIQKQIDGRKMIEAKLEEASREPGRKEIIAKFRTFVSSFPEDMGSMQTQLRKHKEASSDVHSLRADVQSLSTILDRKTKELEALSGRSATQSAEIQKLRATIHDLEESDSELKVILDVHRRETIYSRDFLEARNSEYKAWARVQSLNYSLDEHNLETRVKTAIEAEAASQQMLAAAEAKIADLRQKLERSRREKCRLSDVLKSKHEENEAYLSEIETIGQAYDDIQTQNQQLLQQITERDDYNIKMKSCSDQVQKLSETRVQKTVALENTQRRLQDVRRTSQQLTESLEESQIKVDRSRVSLMDLQIELEKERFDKKRVEEELEAARRKHLRLRSHLDGSSVVEKLQQELKEYKEILKCSVCLDRPKEVVITKCYHLFCNVCVQKIIETRHRKCPLCAASFGANDVKPVYI